MNKEKIKKRAKNQKGSVTLFVLITCLVFMVLFLNLYVGNLNKIQNQKKQIQQIQKNYSYDLEKMESIYQDIYSS